MVNYFINDVWSVFISAKMEIDSFIRGFYIIPFYITNICKT